MKLNISPEKLTRLMLTTNPTLARYKGSIAAIRLLLNTLGIKCIVLTNKQSVVMKYEISGLPEGYSIDDINTAIYACLSHGGTNISLFAGHNEVIRATNDEGITRNGFCYPLSNYIIYKSDTSCEIVLLPFDDNGITDWNSIPTTSDTIPTNISNSERSKYVVKAQTEFISILNTYLKTLIPGASVKILEAKPIVVTDSSNTSTEIVCLLTNISDKNAEPIKSILAKQLQEVLPINIVVTPDNIIGCASDE
jgi:hypothetical protein